MAVTTQTRTAQPRAGIEQDLAFQDRILEGVSRTFALTIPELPDSIRDVVANAYLLCRIADTIEDEAALSAEQKLHFSELFVSVVANQSDPQSFAEALLPLLTQSASADERVLVSKTPTVIRITRRFNARQQNALLRCVTVMCDGMPSFQRQASLKGLADLPEMGRYCYFVAGVVGEMLTELFCDHSPGIAKHKDALMELSISFGQGLQMTNILKDIWEDRKRGACWLPRDMFSEHGVQLEELSPSSQQTAIANSVSDLVAVAHGHLRRALQYTLIIPSNETGIRRFCLWAIGMAILTLRRINNTPGFAAGQEVKISRRAVKVTVVASNIAVKNDRLIRWLFDLAARGVPIQTVSDQREEVTRWQAASIPALVSEN